MRLKDLSRRKKTALECLCFGLTDRDIGRLIRRGEGSVSDMLWRMKKGSGIKTRDGLARWFLRESWRAKYAPRLGRKCPKRIYRVFFRPRMKRTLLRYAEHYAVERDGMKR